MTSRERVRAAIRFQRPDRLPVTGQMGQTDFSGDTVAVFPDFPLRWWLGGGGVDEWGCEWVVEPGAKDMGQVKNRVLADLADFASVPVPDAADPGRYAHWPPILEQAEREGKYVVCCNGSLLWERAHFLHGFEDLLVAVMTEPEAVRSFLRHIARYHLDTVAAIRAQFPGRVHGYRGNDDWGTQTAPLVGPGPFAEVFTPVYTAIFTAVHAAGMDAWLHSCGQQLELLPHLVEAGADVLNLMQPNVFPIPRLAEFRGRVCFEVSGDMQTTLPGGDRDRIAADARALLAACCTSNGGMIVENLMDPMYTEANDITAEAAAFCMDTYRRLDPFAATVR